MWEFEAEFWGFKQSVILQVDGLRGKGYFDRLSQADKNKYIYDWHIVLYEQIWGNEMQSYERTTSTQVLGSGSERVILPNGML